MCATLAMDSCRWWLLDGCRVVAVMMVAEMAMVLMVAVIVVVPRHRLSDYTLTYKWLLGLGALRKPALAHGWSRPLKRAGGPLKRAVNRAGGPLNGRAVKRAGGPLNGRAKIVTS